MGEHFDDPTTPEGLLSAVEKRMEGDLIELTYRFGEDHPAVKRCLRTYEWFKGKRKALGKRD